MDNIFEIEMPDFMKDNTHYPTPEEVEYWRLAKNRAFFIDYEIEDDYRLIELSKIIIRMNIEEMDIPEDELKPIILFLHSYGGDLSQATAFCDIVEASRIPIITVCVGVAMSAGFLIFLAGKRRYALKQSVFLAHEGSAAFSGSADEIREAQKNYQHQLDQMKDYILSHTSIDVATFNKNRKKDWYLTRDEIEKYNIAKIINNFAEIE